MRVKQVLFQSSDSRSTGRRGGGRTLLLLAALVSVVAAGCSKKSEATGSVAAASPPVEQAASTAALAPIPSVLTAWQKGDQPAAISVFVETDWTARPLFASGSNLGLTEAQFKALSAAEREIRFTEIVPHTSALKTLARAVMMAGREAVAQKDLVLARKHFVSLKQCGEALDTPGTLTVVKFIGQAMKKMADVELTKLGQ